MNEIEILKHHDFLYYNDAEPILSDIEYDELKENVKKKYPDDPYFQTVGAPVDGEKVKLPFILGSLNKVKVDTVDKWFEKRDGKYVVSTKLDGSSFFAQYMNGELVFAATRGDGYYGKDITNKAKIFCPTIMSKLPVSFRGEATLHGDLYKKLGFKNRRNGAAGILNRDKDIGQSKYITPIFYEILDAPEDIMNLNEERKLMFIQDQGLKTPIFVILENPEVKDFVEYLALGKRISESTGYDIDGLVIKPMDYVREDIYYPKNAVAFKMNEESVEVEVRGVDWNMSRQGKLKPVVSICPTNIGGVTVSKTTGFNAEFIQDQGIDKGAKILIVRSGDVIPHITGVSKRVHAKLPNFCPNCERKIGWDGVDLICTHPECQGGLGKKIAFFLRTLGAENITEVTIDNLGLLTIEDCYEIDEFDIADMDGFGINKGEQFVNEVQRTLQTKPEKLIKALGMRGIGETVGKLIVDEYEIKTIHDFERLFFVQANELEKIHGIGPVTARTFVDEINSFDPLINFLIDNGLQFEESIVSSISGKIFTLTGKGPMSRQNIESLITGKGGNVKSMSKKTDYLVCADKNSQSGKAKKARSYGTEIITYDELMNMIDGE